MPTPVENDTVVAGRYTLERRISAGGIGALWLARDEQTGESCSLRLADGTGQNMDILEISARYRAEFEIIDQIRCENVVDVMDYGDWRGMPYLVSEYAQGEDLATRLRTEGELSPERAYRLLAQTARALARAHSVGVVHGDVNPENILVAADAPRGVAKLCNFSLTQRASDRIVGSVTRVGSFLRLPYYSSPEQASSAKFDSRSDLWSLAVICYECLTGRKPFESNVYGDLIAQILCGPIPSLSVGSCNDLAALQAWWERACAREPAKRFQTAKELSDALGQVFDFPIVYVPDSNTRGTTTSSAAIPIAMLGTPAESQVTHRVQAFPRISRRSTPLGIGVVNPSLPSYSPPVSDSPSPNSDASFSPLEAKAMSLGLKSEPAPLHEGPAGSPMSMGSVTPESEDLLGLSGSEPSISPQQSDSPASAVTSTQRDRSGHWATSPRLLFAVAVLAAAGLTLTRADVRTWLTHSVSGSNSMATSEMKHSAHLIALPPLPATSPSMSPIVPSPSRESGPIPDSQVDHGAVSPVASEEESSAKGMGGPRHGSSPARSLVSTSTAPAAARAIGAPKTVMVVPSVSTVSPVSSAENSSESNAGKPPKPLASSNSRDYGI